MDYEFQVGDLVTIWTGGWDKRMREQYEGCAGIITRIMSGPINNTIHVDFGWGEIEVSETRIRPLTNEKE